VTMTASWSWSGAGGLTTAVLALILLTDIPIAAQSIGYSYDVLNRLTQIVYADGATVLYTYDAAGNRLTKTVTVATVSPATFTKNSPVNGIEGQPGNVALTWATSSLALQYEYCVDTTIDGSCAGPRMPLGSAPGVSLSGLAPNTTYEWQVWARNSAGATASNGDAWWTFKTLRPFTDPTINTSVMVRAVHFLELRERIDSLRLRFGLGQFAWSNPTLTSGVTIVRVSDLVEMRQALAGAYVSAIQSMPALTDPQLGAPGTTTIRAIHINELRDAVIQLERLPPQF
jgi:YD repeat-containing protein